MMGLDLLSVRIIHALGWTLLHFVWQGFAVAALLALTRVVVKEAGARYAMSCIALLVMVVATAATLASLDTGPSPGIALLEVSGDGELRVQDQVLPFSLDRERASNLNSGAMDRRWIVLVTVLQAHLPEVVLCWLIGVALLTIRLLGGCWITHRLRRIGINPLPPEWQERAGALVDRMQLRRKVEIVTSTIAEVPMVVGIFRPVILIPVATLLGLTHHQLEAILIHELAHIRRYDTLVNLLQRLVETVFFYHPAVWWVSHTIRTDREYCCDDIALEGSGRKPYAEALIALEGLRSPVLAAAASDGPLLSRVRRLLISDRVSARDGLSDLTVSGLLIALTVLAFTVSVSVVDGKHATDGDRTMTAQSVAGMNPLPFKAETSLSSFVGCLRPALRATGVDWSQGFLTGYIGSAFALSMKENGAKLWQAGDHEWSFWKLIHLLNVEQFDTMLKGHNAVSVEKHTATKVEAWKKVRQAIDDGYPAIVWNAMTLEQKNAKRGPLPGLWSLIIGYDEDAETYTVHHSEVGTFTIRYDAIGHSDGAKWFSVMIFRPTEEPIDMLAANRRVLERAIRSYQGTFKGAHAPAHGLAAWEMWLDAFRQGTVSVADIPEHASFLETARGSAAVYLKEIEPHFPENVHAPIHDAAASYGKIAAAMRKLKALGTGDGFDLEKGTEILSQALEQERAAVADLQKVLEAVN